uniref:FlgD immunoglobulin-like domain containing protein n=1 Tax=Treponema sp. TaxID=166 RepID=UPI00298E9054
FDTTAPYGSVTATSKIFSPDGDGRMDFISFKISADRKGGSPISKWTGKIVNVKIPDVSVKEYDFGAFAPGEITWNGLDKNGKLALDGEYDFELFGIDMAGNSVVAKTSPITLDTSKTEVMLAATDLVFSPNADGIKDSVTFTPVIKAGTNVAKYSFEIKNASGKTVYTQSGTGSVPQNFVWNGTDNSKKTLADGSYTACLTIDSSNGAQAKVEVPGVVIDTVAPSVETTASYLVFSPDGDGNKDSFVLNTKNCSQEKLWTVAVTDKSGKVVREFKFNKTISDSVNSVLKWDGIGENGNLVPDGKYSLVISSTDEAGNKFTKKIDGITLDTRAVKAYVTAAYEGISSKSNTGLTKQKFNLRTSVNDGIKNWKFEVVNEKGAAVYSVDSKNQSANASGVLASLPKEIIWDGKTSDDKDAEGIFYGRLTMEYEKGNKVLEKSSSFICTQKAPELSVKTNPEFFSPDDDGTDDELNILLGAKCQGKLVNWSFVILNPDESGKKGKPFWRTNGTNKITEKLIWNGLSNVSKEKNGQAESVQSAMDYPWEFTVTDSIGLTTTIRGKISIDILVRRDGNVLKMAVPAIIFRANHADFKTAAEAPGSKVTPEQARNNERVLKRVAEVLKKFPDYTITVVGHANNTTGTEAEETSTANGNIPLIPLSQDRAAFVKSKLEEYGVEGSRMKTEGKGGRERIAALKDTENWWKNRRVEFLLHK